MMKKVPILIAAAVAISGCASSSKDVTAAYVSPLQYNSYDCDQLALEGQRLSARMMQVGGRLDEAAANDKAITGGGLLFWPALFFLGGTKTQEAEFARMKGEYDASQQAAVMKRCPGNGTPSPTVKPVEKS